MTKERDIVERMSILENHLYTTIKSSVRLLETGMTPAALLLMKKAIEIERLKVSLGGQDD